MVFLKKALLFHSLWFGGAKTKDEFQYYNAQQKEEGDKPGVGVVVHGTKKGGSDGCQQVADRLGHPGKFGGGFGGGRTEHDKQ